MSNHSRGSEDWEYGVLRIPAKVAQSVEVRVASVTTRDQFNPLSWRREPLNPEPGNTGWYRIDLNALQLPDDVYEYEFVMDGRSDAPVPDPFSDEITRFGGYRGIFRIHGSIRRRQSFTWEDEFPDNQPLPNNHELVIYEMPMRWMESAPERIRQVGLGTFEKVAFAHLDRLQELGINAIELLPVQDSPDTLNWGYGTRFFFAPDLDMGGPIALKYFIKQCHRRGIRVIFDVVMNHDNKCPLRRLDFGRYFLAQDDEERSHRGEDYGAKLFRYWPLADGNTPAREFQFEMAAHLIREYHADGFRIDEFRGINHWEFIQQFRDRAWSVHQGLFPGRPFIVIAEDSWRRPVITQPDRGNPNQRKVTDSMWNFTFRDEVRRCLRDQIHTEWGQPARRERVRCAITGSRLWDDWDKQSKPGFYDLAQAVNYLTSHDVEKEHEKRIMNYLFAPLLEARGFRATVDDIRWVTDHLADDANPEQRYLHGTALERLRTGFCLLLTSVGIPMILAGDEFGDVHDLDHENWRLKMSDPVDWERLQASQNNEALWGKVRELIKLRKTHPALLRNETEFFYFHPAFDHNDGIRVFAYCRSRGHALGRNKQVVVVANMGATDFPVFRLPWFWWDRGRVREIARPEHQGDLAWGDDGRVSVGLGPFQARVFVT